jgi:hypothetical protein
VSSGDRLYVTCAKRGWELRSASAYDWLVAVARDPDRLSGVFPGMIKYGDVEAMVAAMEMFDDIERRWLNTARKALGYASGRDWWRALNLMEICLKEWTFINGVLLHKGCDARKMILPTWLDAAYIAKIKNMDENDLKRFEFNLDKVPAGASGGGSAARRALAAFASD